MKGILRHYIIDTFCLYIISTFVSGIIFENGIPSLLLAGVGLTVATLLIKPIINVLLIPLNLITFGLFKWVSSAIALFLVTLVVPGFKIVGFAFTGFSSKWFDIPSINIHGLLAFVLFSFLFSFIASFFHWLTK